MLNVRKYNLLLANGLVWLAVGTKILLIGLGAYGRLAGQRPLWPLVLISLAVFAGFYWMFTGVVRKYAARIMGMSEDRPSLLKTFSPKGYILIAFMISLGIGLKYIPGIGDAFFAAFYCGLGPGLLSAGIRFLLRRVRIPKDAADDCPSRGWRFFWIVLGVLVLVGFTVVTLCYHNVSRKTAERLFEQVESLPARRVAVVFGTNPKAANGRDNVYFRNRIQAANELYRAGKATFFLVSGDNGRRTYDEPGAMRDSLVAHGVPKEVIYCDYAGFNTLSTVIRAKQVFGLDSVIFVSQRFHNERALFLAEQNGLDAVAYNARDVQSRFFRIKRFCREHLARVKMYLDIWFKRQPKYMGDPIEIV